MTLIFKNKISLFSGLCYTFQDKANNITLVGSSFSGKECVYLNNKLISEKRTFKLESSHKIEFEGTTYKIVIKVKSILQCKIEASFFVNEKLTSKILCTSIINYFHMAIALICYFGTISLVSEIKNITITQYIIISILATLAMVTYTIKIMSNGKIIKEKFNESLQ